MLDKLVKPTEVSVGSRINLAVVPLDALSTTTRDTLTQLLNHERIFPSEDGYFRDWRGVFDVVGIPKHYLSLVLSDANHTRRLLELWQSEHHQCKREANLAELQHVLGCIDRWDILDDTAKMFEQDAEQYLIREQKRSAMKVSKTDAKESPNVSEDCDIITKHDTPDHKQQYDAFILYADADIEFATKMIDRLQERGMQLCVKDRDILGGSNFEHEVISRLITERCRRLVVIISKAFLESPLNDFTVTFAQALQIEKKERKVIPCMFDQCELPPHLRYTHRLDYKRAHNLYNFWDKLADSIRYVPRKVGTEMNEVRETIEPPKVETHGNVVQTIVPQPVPKVVVEEPTLVVKLPSVMDQESRTGSLKKSHSFWDIFSSFSHKKDKLNGSTSQLNINDIASSTGPMKASSSPLALIRRDKKQATDAGGASSAPSECPLKQPEKPVKSKKKWYKPSSRNVATAV